jgi:hypothetical protein
MGVTLPMFICERCFQPKLWKRKLLKKALIVESMLVGQSSIVAVFTWHSMEF